MSTLFEEIFLPMPPKEVLTTIRESAASHKWRVGDEGERVLLTQPVSGWLTFPLTAAVSLEPSESGTLARFLLWSTGYWSAGQARRRILQLLDSPPPVYGPPGAPLDPSAPRDLYRPLGSGRSAPAWVARTTVAMVAIFVGLLGAWLAVSWFWGLAGLPFMWLAFLLPVLLRELMFRGQLHLRSRAGVGIELLLAAILPLAFTILWVLEHRQVF